MPRSGEDNKLICLPVTFTSSNWVTGNQNLVLKAEINTDINSTLVFRAIFKKIHHTCLCLKSRKTLVCIFIDDISLPVCNNSIRRTNIILSVQLVKK